MYTHTFVTYLILFCFYNGVFGDHLYMHVYKNKTGILYEKSPTIYFEEDEAVQLTCSIDGSTVKDGVYPTLTWIEGSKRWSPADSDINIVDTKILKSADDGGEIQCKARSEVLAQEWSISVYFKKKKTRHDTFSGNNLFQLLLISLGGLLGTAILLIILYRLILCCKTKRVQDNVPLNTDKEKDLYTEIDQNTKRDKCKDISIGFDNVACQLKDNDTYISFDSPDQSDDYTLTLDMNSKMADDLKIKDERRQENGENNKNNDKMNLKNTEETSDC